MLGKNSSKVISKRKSETTAPSLLGKTTTPKQKIIKSLLKILGVSNVVSTQLKEYQGSSSQIDNATSLTPVQFKALKYVLGERESGSNYSAVNQFGYIGKYQFGALALNDLGLVKKNVKDNKQLNDPNNWLTQGGKEGFLKNSALQENTMDRNLNMNYKRLKSKGRDLSTPGKVAGYLAAAHLLGASGAKPGKSDANGATFREYFSLGSASVGDKVLSNAASSGKGTYNSEDAKGVKGAKAPNWLSSLKTSMAELGKSSSNVISNSVSGLTGISMDSTGTEIGGSDAMAKNAEKFLGKGMTYSQRNRGIDYKTGELMNGASSMDCSSFVAMVVWKTYKIPVTRYGAATASQIVFLRNTANATPIQNGQEEPGDIVMFFWDYHKAKKGLPSHTAIVTGKGAMIHMSSSRNGIVKGKLKYGPKTKIFRIKPVGAGETNVITGMPSVVPASTESSFMPGVGMVKGGNKTITAMNTTIESLNAKINTMQQGLLTKDEKNQQNQERQGLFGLLPVPASCS